MVHYYASAKAMGTLELSEGLQNEGARNEIPEFREIDAEAKRFSEWRGVVESALERVKSRSR
jgi:hypothetical protein